ncbi:MAG: carbon-monoxide dehydrogenase large subunit, partial [Verrucomicrobiales bacterium]
MIGQSVRRLEDRVLVLGQGQFVADVDFPDLVHLRVVRSELASGTIVHVDTTEAASLDGVLAVWTGADVAHIPPIDFRQIGYP